MAETPATQLGGVDENTYLNPEKIWSLLLSHKCVLKGDLNKEEIFTTDIYYLFFAEFCLSAVPLKNLCWSSSSKTNDILNISATPACAVPCCECQGLHVGWQTQILGLCKPAELHWGLFSGSWSSGGPWICKGPFQKPLSASGLPSGKVNLIPHGLHFVEFSLLHSCLDFSKIIFGNCLEAFWTPFFYFLWIAVMENCMHNMLNTFITSHCLQITLSPDPSQQLIKLGLTFL